jgi:Lrp/AsnC family transcriptional regulator
MLHPAKRIAELSREITMAGHGVAQVGANAAKFFPMTNTLEKLDRYDREILQVLQEDACIAVADLSERVGLTASPCWRRMQKLKELGVIRKQVALLDPAHLDLDVTVFIMVKTNQHRIAWFQSFHRLVSAMPEVVEFYRVTGTTDYLLKVVVSDIRAYDRVYKALIKGAELADVTSMFAMEQIKYTTALPLHKL